jgi:transglutaminase-like putative cysteine protease
VRFRVIHLTRYGYRNTVSLSHNVARLRPRETGTQRAEQHELTVSPQPSSKNSGVDYFGNHVTWFSVQEPHSELTITAISEVEVSLALRPDVSQGSSWEDVRQALLLPLTPEALSARQFTLDSPYIQRAQEFADYAAPSFPAGRPLLQGVLDLTERIHREFKYLPGSTNVGTPVLEVLRNRRGVCQDFAHLQICCLRSLGLAARYVSGYIATIPSPGRPRLVGADVSHAWVGVFAPDFGWIDFDPTNGLMPSDGHITVGWARDYDDVGPVRGILIGGRQQEMDVSVDVVPVDAMPIGA